jgi:hypothetical protein
MKYPQNNAELREMAREALNNWTLDSETDPYGDIRAGLEYYASEGDMGYDSDIPSLFESFEGFPGVTDEWDILHEIAIGSQQNK